MMQDAVIRNLEIVGEACTKLSVEFRNAHPDVPWQSAAATRNRLLHGYFDVNLSVVWATVKISIPNFAAQVQTIIADT